MYLLAVDMYYKDDYWNKKINSMIDKNFEIYKKEFLKKRSEIFDSLKIDFQQNVRNQENDIKASQGHGPNSLRNKVKYQEKDTCEINTDNINTSEINNNLITSQINTDIQISTKENHINNKNQTIKINKSVIIIYSELYEIYVSKIINDIGNFKFTLEDFIQKLSTNEISDQSKSNIVKELISQNIITNKGEFNKEIFGSDHLFSLKLNKNYSKIIPSTKDMIKKLDNFSIQNKPIPPIIVKSAQEEYDYIKKIGIYEDPCKLLNKKLDDEIKNLLNKISVIFSSKDVEDNFENFKKKFEKNILEKIDGYLNDEINIPLKDEFLNMYSDKLVDDINENEEDLGESGDEEIIDQIEDDEEEQEDQKEQEIKISSVCERTCLKKLNKK